MGHIIYGLNPKNGLLSLHHPYIHHSCFWFYLVPYTVYKSSHPGCANNSAPCCFVFAAQIESVVDARDMMRVMHKETNCSMMTVVGLQDLDIVTLRRQSYFSAMPRPICLYTCSKTCHRLDIELNHRCQDTAEVWFQTCQRPFLLYVEYKVQKMRKRWRRCFTLSQPCQLVNNFIRKESM